MVRSNLKSQLIPMRKIIFSLLLAAICIPAAAQKPGIRFFEGTWDEAVALAREQDKKIFADFYTEWCGPCLTMSLEVFTLPEVGDLYNRSFVCVKIDAEKGEGIGLARRYGVASYPSYVFVDPATQDMVHRSGSNKSAERFMYDAQGALDPQYGSVAMEVHKAAGGYDAAFLMRYIMMKDASLSRDVPALFAELLAMGHTLYEPDVWEIYVRCISGFDNPYLRQVSDNYDRFVALFGRDAVDAKLASATVYAPAEVVGPLHGFAGKRHNVFSRKMTELLQAKKYEEAYGMIRESRNDPEIDQNKLVDQLSFYVRVSPGRGDDELPFETIVEKVRGLRYVAYNTYDRKKAEPHFEYAVGLEYLISRAGKEGRQIPAELFAKPDYGKTEYTLRHPDLKLKPTRPAK